MQYLSKDGMQYFYNKLKEIFAVKVHHHEINDVSTLSDTIETIDTKLSDIYLRSAIGEKLDYGYFNLSKAQVISGLPTKKVLIQIDELVDGNGVEFNSALHSIKLKKGKTYRIEIGVKSTSVTWDGYSLYNVTTDTRIDSISIIPSTSTATGNSHFPVKNCIYTATDNDDIALFLDGWNSSGRTVNNAYIIIEEIGRTFVVDPMDVKEQHCIEFYSGSEILRNLTFSLSGENNVQPIVTSNEYLNYNTNIQVTTDGYLKLQKDKNYSIIFQPTICFNATSSYASVAIANRNTKETLVTAFSISPNYNLTQGQMTGMCHYTPTEDIEIGYLITDGILNSPCSFNINLSVEEVSKPLVVEYNKYNEVSNPLTTKDISQESPVGSVINYMGLTTPEHYLACDGSVYNIADYPVLAEHFLNELGSYNYFGGDGVNTFAVPLKNSTDDFIYCIKYESTYNAVNQYGGFDTTVLWEGESGVDIQLLKEDVTNYDFIHIQWSLTSADNSMRVGKPLVLKVDDIYFANPVKPLKTTVCQYVMSEALFLDKTTTLQAFMGMQIQFLNEKSFITSSARTYGWTVLPNVTKITGIKGQLPSLMQGGVF